MDGGNTGNAGAVFSEPVEGFPREHAEWFDGSTNGIRSLLAEHVVDAAIECIFISHG